MQRFSDWKIRHAGLFTFAHSAKHIHLYQAFGFWPRSLTAVAAKPVNQSVKSVKAVHFSTLNPKEQDACLVECRRLTGQILEGLDLAKEIRAVRNLNLGETLILSGKDGLEAFAICHCGPGTEAGANTCYIKFGAVRPGSQSGTVFEQMLDACETMAQERGMTRLVAGVNYAREQAAESLFSRGFKTEIQGVVMQRPNQAGYNRPGVYLLDDWR